MSFNNIKFTTKGRNLHAKVQAGAALNFTKIVIGDGDNGGADSSAYDNLLNPLHNISITKLKSTSNGTAIVGGVFNNSGLAAFYLREIGLFATDPDLGEILYCYGNAGASAEYIPEGGGSTILERQLNIVATIGNATSLTALIDYSMYSTMQFVQDEVAAHDIDVAAHSDIRTLIDNLAFQELKYLGYVTTGTCSEFIRAKIAEGYKSGLFLCSTLSDMPVGGIVAFYSATVVTSAIWVELYSTGTSARYNAKISNTDGLYMMSWRDIVTTTQPSWIAATLQNGWTGNLWYRKNSLGLLEIGGAINPGTLTAGTIIAQLPVGYRPYFNKPIPCINANTGATARGIFVNTSGNVIIYMSEIVTGTGYSFSEIMPTA